MKKTVDLIKSNKKIIFYFGCSAAAAIIETVFLLIFKRVLPLISLNDIVYANTLAVIVSSVFHYILTSKLVFKVKMNFASAVVYLITFFIGLGIQNGVIWITYNKLLNRFIENDTLLTLVCKVISLAASFFITYFIRNILNGKLKEKENNNE